MRLRAAAATIWLLSQTVSLLAVPVVLLTTGRVEAVECRCHHSDHTYCPMHHRASRGPNDCVIGSAGDDLGSAVVTALFIGDAPVPGAISGLIPSAAPVPLPADEPIVIGRGAGPDPRPPRA